MTYEELIQNKEIAEYIRKGNENLGVMGYTDHSEPHVMLVADRAAFILREFGIFRA